MDPRCVLGNKRRWVECMLTKFVWGNVVLRSWRGECFDLGEMDARRGICLIGSFVSCIFRQILLGE